jgi:hypothetical protein
MSEWYGLDANKNVIGPIAVGSPEYKASQAESYRRVGRTQVTSECMVSTVFLGLDHGYTPGPPVVFETMVFGGPMDGECERYCTWAEAVEGHARMVEKCQPIMTEQA